MASETMGGIWIIGGSEGEGDLKAHILPFFVRGKLLQVEGGEWWMEVVPSKSIANWEGDWKREKVCLMEGFAARMCLRLGSAKGEGDNGGGPDRPDTSGFLWGGIFRITPKNARPRDWEDQRIDSRVEGCRWMRRGGMKWLCMSWYEIKKQCTGGGSNTDITKLKRRHLKIQSKQHSPRLTHAQSMSFGSSSTVSGDLWMLTGFPCLAKLLHGQSASKGVIAQFPRVPWCTLTPSSTQLRYLNFIWFWSKFWPIWMARGKNFGDVFFDVFPQAE